MIASDPVLVLGEAVPQTTAPVSEEQLQAAVTVWMSTVYADRVGTETELDGVDRAIGALGELEVPPDSVGGLWQTAMVRVSAAMQDGESARDELLAEAAMAICARPNLSQRVYAMAVAISLMDGSRNIEELEVLNRVADRLAIPTSVRSEVLAKTKKIQQ
ncbi:MAG: hypothetical protein KC561_19365 [Myxococcales bacterium]|nr:hypothetical protein [Myxococcales bacterium]